MMNPAAPRLRQSGFTLPEMLAAMLGVFVVVSAATGFLLTAMQRQVAVLQATALEAQHEALAEIMNDSIKSAVDFQIYQDAPTGSGNGALAPGNASGDWLVCVNQNGTTTFHFDGTQFELQQTGSGAAQKRVFPGASRVLRNDEQNNNNNQTNSAQNSNQPIFNLSNLGIVQAQWDVNTTVDQVPFNVFGVPLQMQ
jgi:prepilin-type N-terminal cleavage/methylation domain-containing protein